MSVSHVDSAVTATANPVGSAHTITIPACEAGDTLTLDLYEATQSGTPSISDDGGGDAWALKAGPVDDVSGGLSRQRLYWKRAVAGSSGATLTIDSGVDNFTAVCGVLSVYRGAIASGDPIGQAITADGNSTGALTAPAGAMVCIGSGDQSTTNISGQTCTSPGALTERAQKSSAPSGIEGICAHASEVKASAGSTGNVIGGAAGVDVVISYYITPAPMSFSDQPDNARALEGETASFIVAVQNASGAPTYQWQKDDGAGGAFSNIGGATSSSYSTPTLTASDNGYLFRCVVTDDAGSITSDSARLGVDHNPTTRLGVWHPCLVPTAWF